MNTLLPRTRKADAGTSALPRACPPECTKHCLSYVHSTPNGARCQAPYDLDEIRRAANERLAEGDTDAYLWAMDWIDLCQSARGVETARGRYGHGN